MLALLIFTGIQLQPPRPVGNLLLVHIAGPVVGETFNGQGISTIIANPRTGQVVRGNFAFAIYQDGRLLGVLSGNVAPSANPKVTQLVLNPAGCTGIFTGARGQGFSVLLARSTFAASSRLVFRPRGFAPFVFG
jgi:hypothetical protein